jgi:hypothetical protein
MNHRQLSGLNREESVFELGRSREILDSRFGQARHVAWPFGRFIHMSRVAAEVAFEVGYESCASAERGAHVAASGSDFDALCIRRDQLVAAWPPRHMQFFLGRSSERATAASNEWPMNLDPRMK